MIVPPGDLAAMTEAELVQAYLEMGFTERIARAYAAVLRSPADPHRPVD